MKLKKFIPVGSNNKLKNAIKRSRLSNLTVASSAGLSYARLMQLRGGFATANEEEAQRLVSVLGGTADKLGL